MSVSRNEATTYQELNERLETHYVYAFNDFSEEFKGASDSDKALYIHRLRDYFMSLERLRDAEKIKAGIEREIYLDKWLQKALFLTLAVLSIIVLQLEQGYTIVAIFAAVIYLSYEIKELRNLQLLTPILNEMRLEEGRLRVLGPEMTYAPVVDWQNSFNVKSSFYEKYAFGSFAATLDREIALTQIKRSILSQVKREKRFSTRTDSSYTFSHPIDYENLNAVIPPEKLREQLKEQLGE